MLATDNNIFNSFQKSNNYVCYACKKDISKWKHYVTKTYKEHLRLANKTYLKTKH